MDSFRYSEVARIPHYIRLQYWLPLAARRAEKRRANPSWHTRAIPRINLVPQAASLLTAVVSPHMAATIPLIVVSLHTGASPRTAVVSLAMAVVSLPTAVLRRIKGRRECMEQYRPISTPTGSTG